MSHRRYACAGAEPPLAEVMADPIVHAVMRRDGVTLEELREVTRRAAAAMMARRAGDRPEQDVSHCWRVLPVGNANRHGSYEAHVSTANGAEVSCE